MRVGRGLCHGWGLTGQHGLPLVDPRRPSGLGLRACGTGCRAYLGDYFGDLLWGIYFGIFLSLGEGAFIFVSLGEGAFTF